jgi:cation transport ATPase
MADYYQILGVSKKASQAEIRSAYRKLARLHHPDVSTSPEANEQFARLSEAYRVLSNSELKSLYDLGGEEQLANQRRQSNLHTQRDVYRSRINHIVDQMLEEERLEERARSQAVMVVATLFTSVFIVSLFKPMVWDSIVIKLLALLLFVLGVRFLYQNLQSILEKYTYSIDFLSVTKMQTPKQPFSRSIALVFLASGYFISLVLGTLMGYYFLDDGKSGPYLDNYYLVDIFILPPIAVFLIGVWRNFIAKMDEVFDI